MVEESKQWALQELEKANKIYEPGEKSGWSQLGNVIVWTLEIAIVGYFVSLYFT
jgi:hypothetical protein